MVNVLPSDASVATVAPSVRATTPDVRRFVAASEPVTDWFAVKVFAAFFSGTFEDSRASAIDPVRFAAGTDVREPLGTEPVRFAAGRFVRLAPDPLKPVAEIVATIDAP